MFVKPRRALVEKPSLVASSSGSAKKARYARLFPSTRKSSESRAGASSSWSSSPVNVLGLTAQSYRPAAMPGIEIEPLEDEHLAAAAALLADRHARHREAEPLLPEVSDFRAQLERDLDHELASGVVALNGDDLVAYVIGRVEDDPLLGDRHGMVAKLDRSLHEHQAGPPSFSGLAIGSDEEFRADWSDLWDDPELYTHFVAERAGMPVGHVVLYSRPTGDLRVPDDNIDLSHAATLPAARRSGVSLALMGH